jgi:hypothetical protein
MKRSVLPRQRSEPKWRSLHTNRLPHGARAGRLNCAYICDEEIFLLHRSPLKMPISCSPRCGAVCSVLMHPCLSVGVPLPVESVPFHFLFLAEAHHCLGNMNSGGSPPALQFRHCVVVSTTARPLGTLACHAGPPGRP